MKIANLQPAKCAKKLPALRNVRAECKNGPMRFEEQLHSMALQPGKIRISCRRIQRWLEFSH